MRASAWTGTVFALGLALSPTTVRATDRSTEASLTLPGPTLTAVTADLDGDGVREVVRLQGGDSTSDPALEVWAYQDGWALADTLEIEPIRVADGSAATPQTTGLLRWSHDGSEAVLLVSAASESAASVFPSPCCLAFSLLLPSASGYRIERVPGGGGSGDTAMAADLDADGTDEIVTQRTVYVSESDPGTLEVEVHRWRDGRLEATDRVSADVGYGVMAAETDGRPGDELLVVGTLDGRLVRWRMVDGALVEERTAITPDARGDGFLAGIAAGRIVMSDGTRAMTLRWPPGAQAHVDVEWPVEPGTHVQVLGTGPDALILADQGWPEATPLPVGTLMTLDGRIVGEVPVSPVTERVWPILVGEFDGSFSTTRPVWPYSGPMPTSDGDAYLIGGTLVIPHGAEGFETAPLGPIIASVPVGLAGPSDAWLVMHDGTGVFSTDGRLAALWPYEVRASGSPLTIMLEAALRADPADLFEISLDGAVELDDGSVYAGPDGLALLVDAPAGSAVVSAYLGVKYLREVDERPTVVSIRPERGTADERDQPFTWEGVLILPDGRTAPLSYSGLFVREGRLTVTSTHEPMRLGATIEGTTRPGATVSIEGRPVEVDADGRFTADVDAPPWPRTVVVSAVDPLGNESSTTVEVIGLVDYRGLPWALILATATVAAGGLLYLRTPRQPRATVPVAAEGTLEEIDGD